MKRAIEEIAFAISANNGFADKINILFQGIWGI
jgi:hypothetical protein